ncbi:acyl carrier protein [Streptomyces sp. H27-S2]|uniref:acyl carrier protein n=1 Tax=Streptomyces antarcticus TaxID=2996458 RepID=UPI00226DB339|nr:acyl carrier protein [Streptomyces sp. H27-S2]MCY0947989.1 acyl carrier protein [Streptomyces sp. H27-S2]
MTEGENDMTARVTMDDLKRALQEGSGVDEGVDLDRDLPTKAFADLGYDSLAVLETGLRLGRENNIEIDDSVFNELDTPQQLLDAINQALESQAAAS